MEHDSEHNSVIMANIEKGDLVLVTGCSGYSKDILQPLKYVMGHWLTRLLLISCKPDCQPIPRGRVSCSWDCEVQG